MPDAASGLGCAVLAALALVFCAAIVTLVMRACTQPTSEPAPWVQPVQVAR
ncbi:MAG: hypothetical protein ACRELB_16065 [Polyangiaceae bacterium]